MTERRRAPAHRDSVRRRDPKPRVERRRRFLGGDGRPGLGGVVVFQPCQPDPVELARRWRALAVTGRLGRGPRYWLGG